MKYSTRFLIVFLLSALVGVAWYNHRYHRYGYPFVNVSPGFSYKCMGSGNGRKIQEGEWIQLDYAVKVAEREVLSSKSNFLPSLILFDKELKKYGRIAEIIGIVEEKQRVVFKCSPKGLLGEGDFTILMDAVLKTFRLNKDDTLIIDVTASKIISNEEEKTAFEEAQRVERLERVKNQLEIDKKLIVDYLRKHDLRASETDSGVYYSIDEPSLDVPVTEEKNIKVHYTGKLLDGTVFDTTREEVAKAYNLYDDKRDYKPFVCQLSQDNFIQGFKEGLLLLKKHEKARLFIPSTLAFGEVKTNNIPANAVLLFELEIVDVY